MLYPILLALFILSFYRVILHIFDKKAKEKIAVAPDVKVAVEMRKKLLAKRQKMFVVYIAISSIIVLGLCVISIGFILTLVIIPIELTYNKPKTDIYGNLSFYTQEQFLKENERFYLYLRGFNDDIPFDSKETLGKDEFDESVFAEIIDYALDIPVCALGMTKEIDSPIGAKRVYVDDDDWQDKVLELMNKAERIFILINDRSSCIWEIEKSVSLLDKTVFIADDLGRYQAVKAHMKECLDLPDVSPGIEIPFFFKSGEDARHFENSRSGYFDIIGIDENALEERKVAERKEKMLQNAVKDIRMPFIIIASFLAILLLIILFS